MLATIQNQISDEILITEAISGNKKSLETLVKRYQDYIYNISLRLFLSPDDALDATQEVLIKVVTRLKAFKGESKFQTWLYRIAVNHFLNSSEKKMEKYFSNRPADDIAIEESATKATEEEIEEVRLLCATAMLMCLGREQRLIYIIGEIFGADHNLGADLFSTTPANYRVKLHRAKSDLLNFVSGKCGIVNPENPCRCPKKANNMIAQGIVNKDRMVFNVDFKHKINDIVKMQKDAVSDNLQLEMINLFQDSPFQVKEELNLIFETLLK
jgi:RNA polymerase sigma factor (sigma-70 family)